MSDGRATPHRVLVIDFTQHQIYETTSDKVELSPATSTFAGLPWHLQPTGGRAPAECVACGNPTPPNQRWCSQHCYELEDGPHDDEATDE